MNKIARHGRDCSICAHREREEIEQAFIEWESPSRIAREYMLGSRATVYRHARAFGLFAKRDRAIRAALARIIERGANCRVTAGVVVAAVATFAKLNSAGQWVDRTEHVSLNDLFDKMSQRELEAYASTGQLPAWFERTVGATTIRLPGNGEDAE